MKYSIMIHGMNRLMGTIFIVKQVLFVIGLTVSA